MPEFTDIGEMERRLSLAGVPVAELCRKADIAETTWGRWKGGKFKPSWNAWRKVTDAFSDLVPNSETNGADQ